MVRGLLFLLALASLISRFADVGGLGHLWFWIAGGWFLVFLIVAGIHSTIELSLERDRLRLQSARQSIARVQRRWDQLPTNKVAAEKIAAIENVARDLDLFGSESLFQLLGTVHTPLGIDTMTQWISRGASVDEIRLRQASVKELREQFEWRQRLQAQCELLAVSPTGPTRFVAWAEDKPWLGQRPLLLWIARVSCAVSTLVLLATIVGLIPLAYGGPVMLGLLGFNFLFTVLFAGKIHELFENVSSRKKEVESYQNIFGHIQKFEAQANLLRDLKNSILDRKTGAQDRLVSLSRLVGLAGLRRHGLLGFIAYVPAQFVCLWDFHILSLLEHWQSKHGRLARVWFEALGQWECLSALGTLAWEQPGWVFPELLEIPSGQSAGGQWKFSAKQLGHPLLEDSGRVCNDVEVGPQGSVLLVTGSNMSGKSTLLRSIGVNQTLAQMGSVVCATEMSTCVMRIETSMRIHDQLAAGVSFFMAELKRLKQIVDRADAAEDYPLLFLLDEILQGTNSAERHVAVTHVIKKLISGGAIGAVSTHDLDLAKTDSLGQFCETVHFREHFETVDGRQQMRFDYQMRKGVATSTNALKLLQLVGIRLDSD